MKSRAQLKTQAKEQLKGHWQDAVIFTLIIFIITSMTYGFFGFFSYALRSLVSFVITGPIMYAMTKYFYDLSQGRKVELGIIKEGFVKFKETVYLYLLATIRILLWTLLFIIPGIIAGIKYSQIFYILLENPSMEAKDILAQSAKMMEGHKMKYFVLQLSFFGWGILAAMFTLGIGFLWLVPYINTTLANFYEEVKWEGNLNKKAEPAKTQE